jgi:hypothetical protein
MNNEESFEPFERNISGREVVLGVAILTALLLGVLGLRLLNVI